MFIIFGSPWAALKRHLVRPSLLLGGAGACERAGMNEAALRLVRRALKAEPGSVDLNFRAGRLCFKLGKLDQAVTHLRVACPAGWKKGKFNPARFADRETGVSPRDLGWVLAAAGSWLLKRNEPAQALAFFNRALSAGCYNSTVLNQKALCLLSLGEAAESTRILKEAEMAGGADLSVTLNTAHALNLLGRYGEALDHYERGQRLGGGDSAHVLNNKGFSLFHLRCYEEAAACFLLARELAPDDVVAGTNLAACYYKLRRIKEAERIMTDLAAKSDDGIIVNNLAVIQEAAGQKQKALDAYTKAADSAGPGSEVFLLNRAACLAELGRYEEALTVCTWLDQKHPADHRVLSLKASIMAELGRESEAVDCYRQALGI
ncbi:MAG: tetratricopeptide repeat protein [Bacillota bacterium]